MYQKGRVISSAQTGYCAQQAAVAQAQKQAYLADRPCLQRQQEPGSAALLLEHLQGQPGTAAAAELHACVQLEDGSRVPRTRHQAGCCCTACAARLEMHGTKFTVNKSAARSEVLTLSAARSLSSEWPTSSVCGCTWRITMRCGSHRRQHSNARQVAAACRFGVHASSPQRTQTHSMAQQTGKPAARMNRSLAASSARAAATNRTERSSTSQRPTRLQHVSRVSRQLGQLKTLMRRSAAVWADSGTRCRAAL